MVTVKVTGDLRRQGDHDRPRRDRSRGRRACCRTLVPAAVNEALRQAQELAAMRRWAASTGGARRPGRAASAGCGLPGDASVQRRTAAPTPGLDHRARPAAGHRPAHRPAPGLPHPARDDRGRERARRRDPRGQGAHRPVRGLLQPRRRAALPRSATTSAATRRSSASSRSPATSSRSSARTSSAAATTCSAARCRRSTASTPRT